jgi:hypothetical protein
MRSSRHPQNVDLASPYRQNEGTDDHHYTDGQVKVDVKVAAPTGRLYANQMVDHPIRAMGLRRMRRARSCRH